jgi:dTDP-4-amino-4,6-dideoxygalactose transaminase
MADLRIPMKDLAAQWREIEGEAAAVLTDFLGRGEYVLGAAVKGFEGACAAYLDVPYAVGVGSGTDALLLALRALDVGPGDEVITTPFTFVAAADVVVRLGARPVFADLDAATLNLAPAAAAAAVTPRTKAVVPVHLYGLPADVAALAAAVGPGVAVVEDAAQAMGATFGGRKVGTLGTFGCFSFFPTKNLGGYGDGGLVATADGALAARVRRLRAHGAEEKYFPLEIGYKSRLDGVQAALLGVKLAHLEEWVGRTRALVALYRAGLAEVDGITLLAEPAGRLPAYHLFTIRAAMREELRAYLRSRGIATAVYYPWPIHLTPAFAFLGWKEGAFPAAERAAREVVSLPLWPEMTEGQLDEVVTAVNDFYAI